MTMSTPLLRAVLLAVSAVTATAAAPAAAQQVSLGRLFATPEERGALDRQRDAGPAAASAMNGAPAQPQAQAAPAYQPQYQPQAAPMPEAAPVMPPPASGTPGIYSIPDPNAIPPRPSAAAIAAAAQANQAAQAAQAAAPAQAAPGVPGAAPAPGAPPASSAVQLSGVLRGSSGRTTVWLNQVPQTGGAKAGPGPAVSLRLSSGRQLIIKPGQSFDPANGSVQEIGR